jgi:hypothetical protein
MADNIASTGRTSFNDLMPVTKGRSCTLARGRTSGSIGLLPARLRTAASAASSARVSSVSMGPSRVDGLPLRRE